MMSLGIAIVLISVLGYASNWLNNRFLNYTVIRLLYYIGALVHETSHAVMCVITGATIVEFKVFDTQPRVVHEKSKLPLLGEPLISLAPIAGGLLFLFLVNHFFLQNYFSVPQFFTVDWHTITREILAFLKQINLLQWQSWVMLLLFFNAGAMIGPSPRDLANMWPLLIVFFFITWAALVNIASVAILFIVINIVIQIILIAVIGLLTALFARRD